jgi:hypothetical protein
MFFANGRHVFELVAPTGQSMPTPTGSHPASQTALIGPAIGPAGTLSDRWLDVRWNPPACMLLTVTVASAGAPPESGVTVLIGYRC